MSGRHVAAQRFPFAGDEITVGGIPIKQLTARVGRTPYYAIDRALVTARVRELRALMPPAVKLHYAMKANPMPALVAHLAELVDGVDVASGAELRVALDGGANPQEMSFAGPAKGEPELAQAVACGVLVNVESLREVELLAAIGRRLAMRPRVAVRINPDFALESAGMQMSGGPRPFGIDGERVPDVLAAVGRAGLAFEGFHIFCGSQNLDARSICETQRLSLHLAVRLAAFAPAPVRVLNLGGGFGIPHFAGDRPLDLRAVGENLHALCAEATSRLPDARLVLELGRYLVGEAGVFVARVVDRKQSRGEVFLVADGGLHQHLAASGNFGQVIRRNYPVEIATRAPDAPRETASVVGPLCTPLDVLAHRAELAQAQPGDLVVVYQSGAYGRTASPMAFASHPPAAEVLV